MTPEDRVNAVVKFGFTERQGRFLLTVMLHSGVCLLRQYTAFAGIAHGQTTRRFFEKLVRHGFAMAYPCRRNRGRVYHLHHKPLYRAIGQTDSSHRRPLSAGRVVEGLVLLDALLASPSVVWLATSEEKQVHLTRLAGVSQDKAERLMTAKAAWNSGRTVRDRMPIGIDVAGRWVVVYAVTGDQLQDFHWFLQRHAALLGTLPAWTLRVVFPPHMSCLADTYDQTARNELAGVRPELVNDLRWYFDQRRAHTLQRTPIDDEERYDHAHDGFAATRFQVLYRRWLREGETVFETVSSGAPAEAIQRGPQGTYVYVVKPDKVVQMRRVQLGPSEAGVIAVRAGVADSEALVVDGAEKVQDGVRVEPTVRKVGPAGTPPTPGATGTPNVAPRTPRPGA